MDQAVTKIGKYDVVAVLGQGAMGVVYKGFDPMIKRHVAIKIINLQDSENSSDYNRQRFKREAQSAGNLNHANIVGIYEYGEENGQAYLVMEYVDGETLGQRMASGDHLTTEDAVRITTRILDALAQAHAVGVVHRDIKPANIILSKSGEVKVADFGIARVESSELTQAGMVLGTPRYMSPEQLMGQEVDPRSDIFSAGVVLYEMLSGEKAFSGPTMASVIYKVINDELPPPSRFRSTVSPEFDAVVASACAKNADTRFQSVQSFKEAILAAFHQGQNGDSPGRPGAMATGPEKIPATPVTQTAAPKKGRSARGKRRIAMAAMLCLFAIAAMAIYLLFSATDEKKVAVPFNPGETIKDCQTCPELVVLPSGEFMQGAGPGESNTASSEEPQHLVTIGYPLAVGKYEITRGQFERFVAATGYQTDGCEVYDGQWQRQTGSNWRSPGFQQDDSHPVTCVSWQDAQEYTRWLSRVTQKKYRLLSASEWEYAARAGFAGADGWISDNTEACRSANVADQSAEENYPGWQVFDCRDDYVHTAPVGAFAPNAYGLYDMAGNLFEWVTDCWNSDYGGAPTDGSAWTDGNCSRRVLRGGSWYSRPDYLRVAFRNRFDKAHRSSSFGFRVARELIPAD